MLLLVAGWPQPAAAQAGRSPLSLRGDGVEVVFWPGHEQAARRTLELASRPQRMPGLPDDPALTAGTIYLAPSAAVFDSLTGGRVPHWGAGVAMPALRAIVLPLYPAPGPSIREPVVTLRHELAHLAVHAYLPRPVPRWFDEGYATWVSGGWDQSSAWQIRAAFMLGRAPRLDSLTLAWPRGSEEARLAYLLSASAVQYLIEIGGEPGFAALLQAWRTEGSFDAALRRVYGMTPGQFERDWARMVRRRYGWLLAISQVTVLWGFLAMLLLVLWGVRRRRKRQRMELLEREDRLEEVAEAEAYAELAARAAAEGGEGAGAGERGGGGGGPVAGPAGRIGPHRAPPPEPGAPPEPASGAEPDSGAEPESGAEPGARGHRGRGVDPSPHGD